MTAMTWTHCGGPTGGGAAAALVWGEWWEGDEGECRWPEELLWCCMGSAARGPLSCTCWKPVYSAPQSEPQLPPGPPVERPTQCHDCAYRADSPEQADHRADDLVRITVTGDPFWCHQGIRWPVAWVHPAGYEVRGSHDDYSPPIIDGRPYRADGTPAEQCAGWAARHRHEEQEQHA